MSQNPYAQFDSPGSQQVGGEMGGDFVDPVQSRTSIMAIIGLVISIVGCIACIIPGPGAVAAILGGLAIFFIARSSGRLRGLGLAITAIVLGLVQSIGWIAITAGIASAFGGYQRQFCAPAGQLITAIEHADVQGARALLTKGANAAIGDDDLRDFAKKYRTSLGTLQQTPHSAWEALTMFTDTGPDRNKARGNAVPVPARFSNGMALVMVVVDPAAMHNPSTAAQSLANIGVVAADGTEIWLIDPVQTNGTSPGGPGSAPDKKAATPTPSPPAP
jgi:hypothetical protein